MKLLQYIALAAISAYCWVSPILAVSPALASSGEEQVPVGARPLGLGGSYTALGEGVDALYWNPAGLGDLRVSTARVATVDLHGLGIRDNLLTLVSPLGQRWGVGLEWYNSGFDDGVLQDGLNRISLGLGWRPFSRLQLGATGKFLQHSQTYEGDDQGSGTGFGMDLGLRYQLLRELRLGVAWRDAGGSTLNYDDGSTSRPFDAVLALGIAGRPHRSVLVSADLDRDAHLGLELQILETLSMRGGWTKDLDGLDDSRFSAGFGLRLGPILASYAWQNHPMLGSTHYFELAGDFTLAPRRVELQDAYLEPLFASFYKSYAEFPAGELVLLNLDDEPVELELSVDAPGLMAQATVSTVYLRPGAVQEVPIILVLDPKILETREARPVTLEVEMSYVSGGRRRTESHQMRGFLYETGALSWSDGVAPAAAFITPTHELVHETTRAILRASDGDESVVLNRTTTNAARIFTGLSAVGLRYTPDPLNPYASLHSESFAVDNIQYPAELLVRRSGDCDDSSVLYASMLENVGIRTALVDVPEHIFVLFDTGLHMRDRELTGLDPELFVQHKGSLWIPVETTALGEPFHVAWKKGAELCRRWEGSDQFAVVDVLEARRRYEPAVYAARIPADAAPPALDPAQLSIAVKSDLAVMIDWRQEYLERTYLARLDEGIATADALSLARVYYLNHDYGRARDELEGVEATDRNAQVWNNLANARFALGEIGGASEAYEEARRLDPTDPGIALNHGLALILLGETETGRRELAYAGREAGGVAQAMDLLGLSRSPAGGGRAGEEVALEQLSLDLVERLLREAMDGVPSAIDSTVAQLELLNTPSPSATDSLASAAADSGLEIESSDTAPAPESQPDSTQVSEHDRDRETVAGASRGERISAESLVEILYWKRPKPQP